MRTGKQFVGQLGHAKERLSGVKKHLMGAGRAAVAGAAGAAVVAGKVGDAIREKAHGSTAKRNKNNSGEVFVMKKSTVIALLVALAAVAGVLGALYLYVLRRERELDEYEQLLFSEDFNDDLLDDEDDMETEPDPL